MPHQRFQRFDSCFNPLSDDKILDWAKLKQIEDILSAFKMENKCIVG